MLIERSKKVLRRLMKIRSSRPISVGFIAIGFTEIAVYIRLNGFTKSKRTRRDYEEQA